MPTAWLMAKLRQIGLDAFTHNFTLNYPLGGGRVFSGKNVYGILRAPRIGSTEAIVLATPYRPPDSIHADVMSSIPILLAFANFARSKFPHADPLTGKFIEYLINFIGQNFWSKDIIFLVTEQEQLGMQAWLEAYHGSYDSGVATVLNAGTLEGRAGSIQAAINWEIQGFDAEYIDVKVEGLNGQLPNLDLLNLVQRIALKEGLSSGHKQSSNVRRSGVKSPVASNLWHMFSMILTQSTGVPNGNHGLFHRYGIEAITLEAHKRESTNHQRRAQGASAMIKLVEGISRSLNNLLERFHQSFFFYLLVASDRFVSIGDYIPSLALIAGSLLVKALIIWLKVNQQTSEIVDADESSDTEYYQIVHDIDFGYVTVGKFLIIAHLFGAFAYCLPHSRMLDTFVHQMGYTTELYLTALLGILSVLASLTVFSSPFTYAGREVLHIVTVLETGTTLIIIGMLNFSLGLLLSIFIAPFAIFINSNASKIRIGYIFSIYTRRP